MKKIIFKILSFIPTKIVLLIIKLLAYSKAYNLNPRGALIFLFKVQKEIYALEGFNASRLDGGVHAKHRLTKYHEFFIENIPAGSYVLDIGCGNGALAADIAQKVDGVNILGIDLNSKNIEIAKNAYNLDNMEFLHGDATKDLPNKSFNVIILSNVLEHIEKRVELLRKVKELYNPQKILIRVPMYDRDWRVPLMDELGFDYRLDDTHFIEYTFDTFKSEIAQSGLFVKSYKINWGEIWAVIIKDNE